MYFWPLRRFSFETILSAAEALNRLHAEVGAMQLATIIGASTERRMFLGQAFPDGAVVWLNLKNEPGEPRKHNAFQPNLHVRVEPSGAGARVSATPRPPIISFVLLVAWSSVFLWAGAQIFTAIQHGASISFGSIIFVFGLPAAIWIVVGVIISNEVNRADRLLRAVLERD